MPIERQYAFVDEFGNPNLDLSVRGATSHFVVISLIVGESKIPVLERKLEEIRQRNFQTGEIRSRLVGKNDLRRKKVLKQLADLDFHVAAVVVDKSKIISAGLQWKWSFYKFMNGLLYNELYRTFPNLHLTSDVLGSKEFMQSFKSYVEKKHIRDLFNQADFGFVPSRSNLLIQAADFICGTIARCFDRTVFSRSGLEFMNILGPRIISIGEWPHKFAPLTHDASGEEDPEISAIISQVAINSANRFINDNEGSNETDVVDRIKYLKFLLFHCQWIDSHEWVSTRAIIRNLAVGKTPRIRVRYIRSRIVAPLRDAGVLVASSSHGYKLPANKRDLIEFVNHSNTIIRPIIERIEKCRQRVLLATTKKFDILDYPEFRYLKAFKFSETFNT